MSIPLIFKAISFAFSPGFVQFAQRLAIERVSQGLCEA
jgi:hypothetical protein